MSDLTMFPMHAHLEQHRLEVIAVHWDGEHESALAIAGELERELQMRDAVLEGAHYRKDAGTYGNHKTLTLTIVRRSDGHRWEVHLIPDTWLCLHIHEGRLYDLERFDNHVGEALFRRVRPVVTLSAARGALSPRLL